MYNDFFFVRVLFASRSRLVRVSFTSRLRLVYVSFTSRLRLVRMRQKVFYRTYKPKACQLQEVKRPKKRL